MKGICIVSGEETTKTVEGHNCKVFVSKEVLDFARKYRDALSQNASRQRNVRGVLTAFLEMKNFGHDWNSIKKKLIAEMKDKGISLEE